MKKVGKRDYDYPAGRILSYKNVKTMPDGWVDATLYLPADYDLVQIRTEQGIKTGWHDNYKWDGEMISGDKKILAWRKLRSDRDYSRKEAWDL